ncbi:MAG TPA: alpha-glucuronidase family glycosyl hydrolase [Terracidiphilus sp.]|nr:alpha-glucuronidase family glycosyl hydrolase [Terracidiphilus sp.]
MNKTLISIASVLVCASVSAAQTAEQAWLKYRGGEAQPPIPKTIRVLGKSMLEQSARDELLRGLSGIVGEPRSAGEILLGTAEEIHAADPHLSLPASLGPDDYSIEAVQGNNRPRLIVAGGSDRGALYGAFALLRALAQGEGVAAMPSIHHPALSIRWVDEWDNIDGTIERGYAGRSLFFDNGHVRNDMKPVADYARLLASVGINGCNLNNVNNAAPFLMPEMLQGIARVADTMRPWGVRVALSVDIASPQKIGGLATYDPLDPAVRQWWAAKVDAIYKLIPDFAGFTVKADSEGQPGPANYGRTPADAANTLAAALEPHGGVVLYRAFVYNHHLDWQDPKADRARAAYDIFHPLDGKFAPNVIVQTKEGPIDFQAREPVSPLFGGLTKTHQAMELQITQEYTGQQRHLVYLAPMWKQVLDFDMRVGGASTPVHEILRQGELGGIVGVAGVGQDAWLGSPLALANLYAFGRLAWDPSLTPEQIADEWIRQTISTDKDVVQKVEKMLMQSWPAYESYTGPLGLQTLTDITGSHYGPNVESSERNGWGQWHNADHEGVGFDRSVATGTGFTGQYPPEVARAYESAATTPDDLLLFFHHVPYTYKLHDGKTVIQYLYDSHYAGAAQAAGFVRDWQSLQGRIDPALYANVLPRLEYQAGHAIVWRDAITQYFLKLSGIPDEQGRAGHYPGRLEAEDARLTGYKVIEVTPWEDASLGKAVACDQEPVQDEKQRSCTADWTYSGNPGRFDVAVQYFDLQGGVAHFTLDVNDRQVASWAADATLPSRRPNGDNSTRFTAHSVDLHPGDVLRLEGTPDGADPAALDYIELEPSEQDSTAVAALNSALTADFARLAPQTIQPADGYIQHPYLIPAGYYPQMWDWDGFFIGLHWANQDPANAKYLRDWALSFAGSTDKDGYVPGCITSKGPRPLFGKFAMKPFLAQGALIASQDLHDYEWLRPLWPAMQRVLAYRKRTQFDAHWGLWFWDNAMQSGADNNAALTNDPRDPSAILAVDASVWAMREYAAMAVLAGHFGDHAAARAYRAEAAATRAAIFKSLWDAKDARFFNRRRDTGARIESLDWTSFLPLLDDVLPPAEARRVIREHLLNPAEMRSAHGFRSLARSDPAYNNAAIIDPYSNWRGPIWINANFLDWMILRRYGFRHEARALTLTLAADLHRDIEKWGLMHEDYNAETGDGLAPTPAQSPNGKFAGFVGWNLLAEDMLQCETSHGHCMRLALDSP